MFFMGKEQLNLSIEGDIKQLAMNKFRGQISSIIEGLLETELKIRELPEATTKDELINKLKSRTSIFSVNLREANEKIEKLEKELKEKDKKITELHEKLSKRTDDDHSEVKFFEVDD